VELDFALLADSAQVSQGKTYVLGGGVSILWRSQFPAALNVVLVVQLAYHRSEVDTQHVLRVKVVDADGASVIPEVQATIQLGPAAPGAPSNVPLTVPLVLAFPPAPSLQAAGAYAVDLLLDDRHVKSLAFAVAEPEA
jgi:hypothetical protein